MENNNNKAFFKRLKIPEIQKVIKIHDMQSFSDFIHLIYPPTKM